MSSPVEKPKIRELPNDASTNEILRVFHEDGGLIIKNFLSADQVQRFSNDITPALDSLHSGSTNSNPDIAEFHGQNTKRLTNLVTISKTFRDELVDHDQVHELAEKIFVEESGTYWMTTAQVIDIGPGNKAQPLHRDLENNPHFLLMGPKGPETAINFLIALTDFTEENGATRVIPGSHVWPDFKDRGKPEMTIPAVMQAGDALFISGKIVHGGGSNQTTNVWRKAVAFAFQPGFLTPEEAYPFVVDMKLAKTMSERAQRMIGFRSQYPKDSPGLWQVDYSELANYLGLQK